MLKGASKHVAAENARSLRQSGVPQSRAISLSVQRQSLNDRMDRIRDAVTKKFRPTPKKAAKGSNYDSCCPSSSSPYPYVKEVFGDHVIMELGSDLYKVPITDTGTSVTVGEKVKGRMVFQGE